MTKSQTLILLIFLLALVFFIKFIIDDYKYKNQVIKVYITLKNNCELIDSAFMVSSLPEKKIAFFENKKTVMYLKRSSKVQLQASNKFDGFHYSSVPVNVERDVVLEANCTEKGRLDDIFDSLKKQFKE